MKRGAQPLEDRCISWGSGDIGHLIRIPAEIVELFGRSPVETEEEQSSVFEIVLVIDEEIFRRALVAIDVAFWRPPLSSQERMARGIELRPGILDIKEIVDPQSPRR